MIAVQLKKYSLSPTILQPRHPIEHRLASLNVIRPIRHKIPKPLKLKLLVGLGLGKRWFHECSNDLQAVRIQVF
jgi:hypothetical protein